MGIEILAIAFAVYALIWAVVLVGAPLFGPK